MYGIYVRQVVTALPAPDYYVVSFDHPRRRDIVVTCLFMSIGLILAFLFVLQKLYVDLVIRHRFGLDNGKSS